MAGHHGEETQRQVLLHGYLPVLFALIVFCAAIGLDLAHVSCCSIRVCHWTMRAGSVIAIFGIYVAFRAGKSLLLISGGRARGVNFGLPYGTISFILLVAGVLIWGFADIWI